MLWAAENLRTCNSEQILTLCSDLREFLVESVSKTGGHLASNLGVVELTIALHRVFDTDRDRIVWDVGHQSYVHKILTGRADCFSTLRQKDGMSGFPRRNESPHDAFDTGHSSTSLSAAFGLALARSQKHENQNIVAVIGDGALTGGMCYEALNQIGSSKENMIMILNDNAMSISPNVGAMSYHLSRFRSNAKYLGIKRKMMKNFPRTSRFLERIKNSIKYTFTSSSFFEELGIKYLGPIDGHNEAELEEILKRAKGFQGPILVHVMTQKGRGYKPAEESPTRYHGIAKLPASNETENISLIRSNSDIFGDTLVELAQQDERIVAITAAMSTGTGLDRFAQIFPNRFWDVGIAEQHAVTMAAGLAVGGMRPVVALYSTFLQRAYDQVLHDVCLQKLPVVFAVDRAGLVGEDGSTHQGVFDIGFLSQMPGLTILSPATQEELAAMLSYAFTLPGPVAIRYPRKTLPQGNEVTIEYGAWQESNPNGKLALIATGSMVAVAEETAKLLKIQDGASVTVVNARFLSPMDTKMLSELNKRCTFIATLEEGVTNGGLGEHTARFLLENDFQGRFRHFALPDRPLSHATVKEQQWMAGLDASNIAEEIRKTWESYHERKEQA